MSAVKFNDGVQELAPALHQQAGGLQSLALHMKRIFILIAFFLLTSCAPLPTPQNLPTPKAIVFDPRRTATSALPLATVTSVPCDPYKVDFCITDGHFILQRPIKPPANDSVDATYRYGSTADGRREPHHGVEFENATGTPVYATADGTVLFAGPDKKAIYCPWENFYGNLVVIKHESDLFTLYAHLSKIDVEAGEIVKVGGKIGEVGRTGVAVGSHLHFEVRHGYVQDYFATQNPELWLIPAKDVNGKSYGTLMISVVNQDHHLIKYAELTAKHYLNKSQSPIKSYYLVTYPSEMVNGEENAAIGELPPGSYRIALKANSQMNERWVEVESGKLTQVVFVVK